MGKAVPAKATRSLHLKVARLVFAMGQLDAVLAYSIAAELIFAPDSMAEFTLSLPLHGGLLLMLGLARSKLEALARLNDMLLRLSTELRVMCIHLYIRLIFN